MTESPMPLPELRRRICNQTASRTKGFGKTSSKNTIERRDTAHKFSLTIKNTRRVSKCLDTGVSKVRSEPVPSHLFNSWISQIHPSTSHRRTTITTTSKAWSAVPLRLSPKATPVLSYIILNTIRSTSDIFTYAPRLSSSPHTPPGSRLMYSMERVVHVLVLLLFLTSLIPLSPKAELL